MKIAFLSSYTMDLVAERTRYLLGAQKIEVELYIAPFGQYRQEILAPDSPSRQFAPDIVILAVEGGELISDPDESLKLIQQASTSYPTAQVLVYTAAALKPQVLEFLEWNSPESHRLAMARFNCRLAESAQQTANLKLLDLQRLLEQSGSDNLLDNRFYNLALMPFGNIGIERLAQHLVNAIMALAGKRKKCLVLDLDNTLWGGIVGEDGIEHLKLGQEAGVRSWLEFQRQLLRLYESGVLLAICSKNDEAVALDVIDKHPSMVLRRSHFAAWRINWLDKAENMKALAEELNLGLDAFVFLDDSPHERAYIKSSLPEVTVPELPADPSDYAMFLARLPYFETFTLTAEDKKRGELYAAERTRKTLAESSVSLEDFLKSLDITITLEQPNQFTIPRIAQLTQKTNQLNLTTRRYTEADIRRMAESNGWKILAVSVSDRLGQSGLVGVAILALEDKTARLDSFLVSCRVLGRGVEEALLSAAAFAAFECGANGLKIEFIQTNKNSVALTFLEKCHLHRDDGWYLIDRQDDLQYPAWIKIENEQGPH